MAELALKNVFVNYFGAQDTIHAFSHVFHTGLNVLYAAEGGGKTTLLKTIAGLVAINAGEIIFDGADYSRIKPKDKGIAMVFDDLALRLKRSARFNLELPLKLRKYAPEVIKERVEASLIEFGLSPNILDVAVFRLSEECKVRLSLARAFIRESDIILIDNPFSRLSPDVREELFVMLLSKTQNSGAIVIYATDSSREAEMTVAETTVLSYGYLTDCGFPEDFRRAPGTVLTAEKFIRYSCSYNIELEQSGSFNLLGMRYRLSAEKIADLIGDNYLGNNVIAVVPPESVKLNGDMRGTILNLIGTPKGQVAIIAVNGDVICAYVGKEAALRDSINISIDADKIFLFDAANEKTILKYQI